MQVQVAHGAPGESAKLQMHELVPVRDLDALGMDIYQLARLHDIAGPKSVFGPHLCFHLFVEYDVHYRATVQLYIGCSSFQIRLRTTWASLFHNCSDQAQLFGIRRSDGVKKEDRRVQRTKQLLRGALFALIQEKGFEALSVQDIIDRANVGRATFYAHFDNKEDLLLSGFDDLRASLRARQREALSRQSGVAVDERVFAFSHDMLAHVNEYRHLFLAMTGKRSGAAVQNVFRKLVIDLVRDDLRAMVARSDAHPTVTDAVVEFIGGGLFGLLTWWLTGKAKLSVEEVNALFRRFAIPAAKAALRP
jgi:AcrR family transcriptional regulator